MGPREFPALPRKNPRFVGVNISPPLHFRHLCYSLTSQVTLFPHLTPGSRKNLLSVPAAFSPWAALRMHKSSKKSKQSISLFCKKIHVPAKDFNGKSTPGRGFVKEIDSRPRICNEKSMPGRGFQWKIDARHGFVAWSILEILRTSGVRWVAVNFPRLHEKNPVSWG